MANSIALPTLDVSSRVAAITGGGQGLGRAYAQALAAAGAAVAVLDINSSSGQSVAEEIVAQGGRAVAVHCDVADPDSVARAFSDVESKLGAADILINNAAIFSSLTMRPFDEISTEEWRKVLGVNMDGVFYCSRAAVKGMREKGWGRIINVSSSSVPLGLKNYLHYVGGKAAVEGMTSSMARELGQAGITVNCLVPGATETEVPRATLTPALKNKLIESQCIPRMQVPDDLIGPLFFLLSSASDFITGQCIAVNGGLTHR